MNLISRLLFTPMKNNIKCPGTKTMNSVTVLLLPYRNMHILQGAEVTEAQLMIIVEHGNILCMAAACIVRSDRKR